MHQNAASTANVTLSSADGKVSGASILQVQFIKLHSISRVFNDNLLYFETFVQSVR